MSLTEYRRKRDFKKTPEPAGEEKPKGEGGLHFVVQKHHASRLHYDFRLELDGVLLSWAVPKGPSMDPEKKKLAMQVEDHPFDYRNFEGVIEEGNYGAGSVIIWDEGEYHAVGVEDRAESERKLRQGLAKGQLDFVLHGQRLKGMFLLIRMKDEDNPNAWLLMKKKDEHASKDEILEQKTSVRSGRTLEEVKADPDSDIWTPAGKKAGKKGAGKKAEEEKGEEAAEPKGRPDLSGFDLEGSKPGPFPEGLDPMLATLASEPFDREGWLYELKWDGFRAMAEVRRGRADLCSRHNKSYVEEFKPLVSELIKIGYECVPDGEVVVVDDQGRAEFRLLQEYRRTGKGMLVFYAFDLLYLEGQDLRTLPLRRRKALLRQLLPDLPRIKYSDHVEKEGVAFYKLALEHDLEGIIAKDMNSAYRAGARSQDWLKFKTHQRQEAVIAGWTEPKGTRDDLGALLLGVYENRELVYVGHTGGGFTAAELAEMKKRLEPLKVKEPAFKTRPKTNAPPTWVEPTLIAEVKFAGWTNDGMMRQPIFLGLREDKEPTRVFREKPLPTAKALERKKLQPREAPEETTTIDGREVTISNPRKVFWPEQAITKGDMVDYYCAVSPVLLPYLRGRPLSLHRFPNGIQGKSFFQKDVDVGPEWLRREKVESPSAEDGTIDYVVVDDEAALAWIANLGTIELNPWFSRVEHLDRPDYLVFDLDPLERTLDDVVRVAQTVHQVLEAVEVTHRAKTSGATGLHIYVSLGAQYGYEQARQFALLVSRLVHGMLPDLTSLERSPAKRRAKVYLDYLQNRPGQTIVAPYSLRPRPGAPVSTPLEWDEVQPGLNPATFNIKTILPRIEEKGDLFAPVLGPGIDMLQALERLQKQWTSIRKSG